MHESIDRQHGRELGTRREVTTALHTFREEPFILTMRIEEADFTTIQAVSNVLGLPLNKRVANILHEEGRKYGGLEPSFFVKSIGATTSDLASFTFKQSFIVGNGELKTTESLYQFATDSFENRYLELTLRPQPSGSGSPFSLRVVWVHYPNCEADFESIPTIKSITRDIEKITNGVPAKSGAGRDQHTDGSKRLKFFIEGSSESDVLPAETITPGNSVESSLFPFLMVAGLKLVHLTDPQISRALEYFNLRSSSAQEGLLGTYLKNQNLANSFDRDVLLELTRYPAPLEFTSRIRQCFQGDQTVFLNHILIQPLSHGQQRFSLELSGVRDKRCLTIRHTPEFNGGFDAEAVKASVIEILEKIFCVDDNSLASELASKLKDLNPANIIDTTVNLTCCGPGAELLVRRCFGIASE